MNLDGASYASSTSDGTVGFPFLQYRALLIAENQSHEEKG
jgi:hypothetical protein